MTNEEVKNLIASSKNICLIPNPNEPESLTAVLALFYTLKDLGKNVNLICDQFPEKLNFLLPSLDFISQPKNFVISIPRTSANISQIYYEKSEESIRIHLTIDSGQLKKEHIALYASNAKPDVVIAMGIPNFQQELSDKLDSYGYLLDSPIINIDNNAENVKFGQHNIVEPLSLSELALQITDSLGATTKEQAANCLLAGMVLYYENFANSKTTSATFQTVSDLIKKGAHHSQIIENLHKTTEQEVKFLGAIFENLKTEGQTSIAVLESDAFYQFSESQAATAVEKIKTIGFSNDVLVLWKSHNSEPAIKGFFYSKKPVSINKFAESPESDIKNGWVFLNIPGDSTQLAKEKVFNLL